MTIDLIQLDKLWQSLEWLPDTLFITNKEGNIIKQKNDNAQFIGLSKILSKKFKKQLANGNFSQFDIQKLEYPSIQELGFTLWRVNKTPYLDEIEKSKILDSLTDSAALITTDYKIKYANKTFKDTFGVTDRDFENQTCYKLMYNLSHPCLNCTVQKVSKTKAPHRVTRSEKDGPIILNLTYPVITDTNEVTSCVVTFRDITSSRNIEKALKKEATINKAIAEISQAIIMPQLSEEKIANKILSVALLLTKSSTGYVASVDFTTNKMIWRAFENFTLSSSSINNEACFHNKNLNCLYNHLNNSREIFITNHLSTYLQNNNIINCNITRSNCIMAPASYNNHILGQIYVAGSERPYSENDIELLKQLSNVLAIALYRKNSEIELIKAKEEAEENNKLKSAFLANMSHEIRTPMNSINGFSELLKNTEQPPESQKECVDIIYKSSNQLLNIIDNILDISKLEVGQVTIIERENDLNQVIYDSLSNFNPDLYLESPVEFKTYLPIKGADAIIYCDAPRLQQVLSNLIQNALKFTPKGFIEIGYALNEDNFLQFYVKDTGIGIAKEKHAIIFERFGQAEQGSTRNYRGAGLGLPICKGFIELMGGTIWFESEPGLGSIFYFTVPYKPVAKNLTLKKHIPQETKYNWKSKKILLVEDESFSQNFIQTILLPHGPKIIYSEDGFSAIEQIRMNPDIDIVLMDIRLPRLDGIETTIRLRKDGFTKPIIAQTANALPEDRKKCMDAGCNEFIVKPIARVEFLKTIDKFISAQF